MTAGGNPLVAQARSQTTGVTGIGIAESAVDLANGVSDGSWVEAGLGAVGVGLEVLSLVVDPIGTLASYGVSWLIEHVRPLKEALDWLAGDPPVIQSFSETWANVAGEVNAIAGDLTNEVNNGTAGWQGEGGDAYRGAAAEQADALAGAASLAEGISAGVMIMGTVVAAVREFVRDLVAELVGKLITWALEAAATLGFATPAIAVQATTAITKTVSKIADFIRKLVKTIGNVSPKIRKIIDKLGEIIEKLSKMLRKGGKPGGGTTPSSAKPNAPKSPDTTPNSPDTTPTGTDTTPDGGGTGTPDGGKPGSNDPSVKGNSLDPNTASRERQCVPGSGEPVDVATGQMYLGEVDVSLPGALPLTVERMHYSEYRAGRLFGASWASTLDQRIEFEDDGAYFAGPAGERLIYPLPARDGSAVFPVVGPRWPLTWSPEGWRIETAPGTFTTFTPAEPVARLASISDHNGHRIDIDYDDAGLPQLIRHSGGYRIHVGTEAGLVTELRAADVTLARYRYNERRQLTEFINSSGLPMRFDYDADGRIVRWEDRNGQWYGYTYDERGRVVSATGSGGAIAGNWAYDDGGRITVYTDSLGQRWEYHRNEREQVVREVSPLGGVVLSEWNRYHQLLSRTDALGNTMRWEYDARGDVVAVERPDGARQSATYDEHGNAIRLVDAEGAVWEQRFDSRGNLVEAIDPTGARESYTRDERGNLSTITDAAGAVRRIVTNAAGLAIATTEHDGATTRYERDLLGRVVAVTDPMGGITRFGWTVEGRPLWRTEPDGTTERWDYDGEGNEVGHTDALGATSRGTMTHFDRVATELRPDGSSLRYEYDSEMRLVAVTDGRDLVWRYTYDGDGNLVREKDFNGAEIHYRYDAAGRLVERVNAEGQTIRFTRDPLGRVVERDADGERTSLRYDAQGRLTWARNADAELSVEYDAVGRVLRETVNGRTLQSTFDAVGRRTSRQTPSGAVSTWDYATTGPPRALHTAGHTLHFGYDQAGRETDRRSGGLTMTQTWDSGHRLRTQAVTTSGGRPGLVQRRSYSYRGDGALRSVVDQLAGAREFDLDPGGRVTAVRGPGWSERYAYDASGALAEAEVPAEEESPRILCRYDRQGRVLLRQRKKLSGKPATWHYTWNAEDRLTAAVTPDGTMWRYRYDPLGRRIAKEKLSEDRQEVLERTDFNWDGTSLAEQATSRAGEPAVRVTHWDYQPGTDIPITQSERSTLGAASQEWVDERFYSIVTDLVGAPTELLDANGEIAWRRQSTIWGRALSGVTSAAHTPLRFPGQYEDAETGLHYNVLRYYDPEQGRYTSPDPLGLLGGPNPHGYVPNPLQWTDALALTPSRGQTCPWAPTYRDHQRDLAGIPQDGHHIIQDAAVRDLPGYNRNDAPSIALGSPSSRREGPDSTEHGRATAVQVPKEGRGTYGAERDVAYRALLAAGKSPTEAAAEIARADLYFMGQLGVTLNTPTRIPGTRR
ncbi:RHS repeat-associated core domain-containing protein [Amycolatopsis sp. NPDC051071]|uniref:RHS repeat-associated core domain-containing protein n=1 Tax=Amycolatopsis sp. NPDC051071 TaxID=3154637 RepID=UPI00342A1213